MLRFMCAHFEGVSDPMSYARAFQIEPPVGVVKEVWPGYPSSFIRRPFEAGLGDEAVPDREALAGIFGLIPHWAKDAKIARHTYNARSETVSEKPSFRDAWNKSRHCIIPAQAFYEPDWRSGKAVATRISRSDGQPMGLAGLWSLWKAPQGKPVLSFTLLTVNANDHALMRNFHKPSDEKRMVVVLPEDSYTAWLTATVEGSMDFMRRYRDDGLVADRLTTLASSHRNAELF